MRAAPRRTAAASEGTVAGSADVERKPRASVSAFWAVRLSVEDIDGMGTAALVMKTRAVPLTIGVARPTPALTSSSSKLSPCAATAAGDKVQLYCRGCCMAGAGGVRGRAGLCVSSHLGLACQFCLVHFQSGPALGRVDTLLGTSVDVLGTRLLDHLFG